MRWDDGIQLNIFSNYLYPFSDVYIRFVDPDPDACGLLITPPPSGKGSYLGFIVLNFPK
jgi:hypothetical protein